MSNRLSCYPWHRRLEISRRLHMVAANLWIPLTRLGERCNFATIAANAIAAATSPEEP
jgi:hypothetical protein